MEYQVMDGQTKQAVGQPMQSKARARAKAERLDLEHGSYRYFVKTIFTDTDPQVVVNLPEYPTANDLIKGLCRLGVL